MCDTWHIWEVLISIRRSRSSAILKTKGTPRGRFWKHQIPIGRMTTDGTRRSSVDSSGARDGGNLHQSRTIGRLLFFREETMIDARSWPDHRRSPRQKHHLWKLHDRSSIALQSKPDRQAIMARSSRDRGPIVARSYPRFRLIHHQIGAELSWTWSHDQCQRNHPHDAIKPLPGPHQSATIFGPNFSLKTDVFLSCSSTFDRIVKKLSEFRGRSLVHRDPPDLDSSAKQLERDWSRISPWFHRIFPWILNVHEEESEQIRFNPRELKPHPCGNRVSSEIWLIIRR